MSKSENSDLKLHCQFAFCILHFASCILRSAFCILHFAFCKLLLTKFTGGKNTLFQTHSQSPFVIVICRFVNLNSACNYNTEYTYVCTMNHLAIFDHP